MISYEPQVRIREGLSTLTLGLSRKSIIVRHYTILLPQLLCHPLKDLRGVIHFKVFVSRPP